MLPCLFCAISKEELKEQTCLYIYYMKKDKVKRRYSGKSTIKYI